MIVVDSSALIEIVIDGARAEACMAALENADRAAISAGTMTESLIVATGRDAERPLTDLLDRFGFDVVPVTRERAKAAADGYRRFGRRRHPEALNLGDCFAYALAKELDCPLLFVGADFARTDVASALS